MVLDKSQPAGERYDILYADLDGNGDLTQPAERITAEASGSERVKFDLPDFTDPETGDTHTEFRLSVSNRNPATHMISLLWRGEHKFGGGYPEEPALGYMRLAESAKDAPIACLNGDGPFGFQRWYSGELPIGGSGDFKVFLGIAGVGSGSFCAFQRYVLPADEPVLATLIYWDKEGNQQQVDNKLTERC